MPESSPSNLPLQLTSFIGREREIAEVKRLLGATRLLTLTGSGGCGKTRLALQVAVNLRDEFPDGIWLADLAPLSDSTLVPQTLASVFDLPESAETPLIAILQHYFRTKRTLLVLNNCEHLIQACAELCDTLLRAGPELKILATSREALNLAGENSFRVPPLALPDPHQLPPLEILSQYEAIRLFIARAKAARSDFQFAEANAHRVAQICWRLDGMPLAIELAAARVNSLSIEEIAARLDDRFRLLHSGSRITLPRYQTLRASIDWSYDLLSDAERALLQRLAIFAGGFTVEAVESVCAEQDADEILDVLSRLVQKSLVVVKLDEQPRYRLLETIRQYAREKLEQSSGGAAVRDRHLTYFTNFAQGIAPLLHGPEQMRSLAHIDSEHDNLRAALEWSLGEGRVEKGLRLAAALMWYWERRGYFTEGLARVQSLLNQPEAVAGTLTRANALIAAGLLANSLAAVWVGGSKASRPYLEEAIAIAREHGQAGKRSCALALTFLSNTVRADNPVLAQSQYDEAWTIVQELNETWLSALLLHQRAHWFEKQDDKEAAAKAFEDSLNLFRSTGDKRWEAILLFDIASKTYAWRGDYGGARRIIEKDLSYFRETRDRMHICFNLSFLGDLECLEGHYELAKRYFVEELEIGRELGSKLLIASAVTPLGFCAIHDGELESARSFLVESLALARELGKTETLAHALAGLGCIEAAHKRALHAIRIFGAADALLAGTPYDFSAQPVYDEFLARAREQFDEVAFYAAWDEGHAMTVEQAIEAVLAEPDREPRGKASPPAMKEKYGGLTPREREVAVLIAQGKSNPQIAEALVVSERTVTTHVGNILSKLGFKSRTQIASWATAKRLSPPETKA